MEILGKILCNPARVKIMRLFLFNKGKGFESKDIVKRSMVNSAVVGRELKLLSSVGFIKRRARSWYFNPSFKYGEEFENLLLVSDTLNGQAILNTLKKAGKIKLLVISGIFIKNPDSRVDLLIVGDRMSLGKIKEGVRKIEAELGTELSYTTFDTKEFVYRLDMYDKLVRDILDYPHEVVFATRELSTQALKKA